MGSKVAKERLVQIVAGIILIGLVFCGLWLAYSLPKAQ
jgi:hypothetical protein